MLSSQQGITLLWTLLKSGHQLLGGEPLAKRIVICCPVSLVNNWDKECNKWLEVWFPSSQPTSELQCCMSRVCRSSW